MDADVGGGRSRLGIDRGDGLAQQPHAGLGEVAVGETDLVRPLAPKQQIELGESEDERIATVDQRYVNLIAKPLRETGCHLEPTESGTQNQYTRLHISSSFGSIG
jgi:hypothetical protein